MRKAYVFNPFRLLVLMRSTKRYQVRAYAARAA
jgi:hypothetical protein